MKTITLLLFLLLNVCVAFSQPPPPPVNNSTNRSAVPGSGAPIGDDVLILATLSLIYAGKKVYALKKDLKW